MSDVKNCKDADELYCSRCGELIKKDAEICPKCGVRLINSKKSISVISLVFGIFSMLIPIVGMITAAIGLVLGTVGLQDKKRGIAITGIILSSIGYITHVILFIIVIFQNR